MPQSAPDREGITFLKAKEAWLRGHLGQLSPLRPVGVGESVMVRGQMLPIVLSAGRRVQFTDCAIEVPQADTAAAKIKAQLKQLARDALAAASDGYAGAVGRSYSRLTIRDTRSRWGSCSSSGTLMYSWRLIMAPPEVLDYVAAHEVAHLVEMNHSPAFWAVVRDLYPNYEEPRQWLRANGDQLHRVQFDN
jgi:predicted metal-dependent hydrolase